MRLGNTNTYAFINLVDFFSVVAVLFFRLRLTLVKGFNIQLG